MIDPTLRLLRKLTDIYHIWENPNLFKAVEMEVRQDIFIDDNEVIKRYIFD